MARRTISWTSIAITAYSDTTDLGSGNYPFFLQGGSSTQQIKIHEINITGQSGASAPTFMILSRDSQIGTAGGAVFSSGGMDASNDTATAALAAAPVSANNATTSKPQRSSTLHLANCNLNAFGGSFFIRFNKWDECYNMLGNTASFGELSLSAYSGGTPGTVGGHTVYEPL